MKLKTANVTNYRNIIDSNVVEIGQVTCLVGKNEAGKTAFLKALEGLRSTNDQYKKFDRTENYPRRFVADYKKRHPQTEAVVIRTKWLMDDSDVVALESQLGEGSVGNREFEVYKTYEEVYKTYEEETSYWPVTIDQEKVVKHLIKRFNLSAEERAPIKDAKKTASAAATLEALQQKTEKQNELLAAIKKFRKSDADLRAIDILSARMPKFLYFSHYDRMAGQISIKKLNDDKANNRPISVEDQLFLDFLEYAGTDLDDLISAKKYEELNARCEGAANRITEQIFEYWTQNDQLAIDVRFTEGRSEDPAPFNTGAVARARVVNHLHRVSVPFSERSAGFIWFFSFLVKFAQVKNEGENIIILLDEPGLTLHGTAQHDLLRYFSKELEPTHQLIYTTHSPFMVPADQLSTVRTVEDVVVMDDRQRKQSLGTKIRSDILTTDPQTNFPIFGAIGFEVTQTLIVGRNTLLVEGPSDILYLQAASAALKLRKREYLSPQWAICPSGGIDKILPFVRLFYGNRLNVAVLADFERGQKRKLDDLYKSALLDQERITLATDIAGKSEADIEDFFEPELFVDLVNLAYALSGTNMLTAEKLNAADQTTERLVKKAEAYFRTLPSAVPMFSHYEPAIHLLKTPSLLEGSSEKVEKTLARFEAAFNRIEKFVEKKQ